MPAVAALSDLELPRKRLQVGKRVFKADQDPALAVLLTAASWCLQRLPGHVVEEQRGALVRALSQSRELVRSSARRRW